MADETIRPIENQEPEQTPGEAKGSFRSDLYYWLQALVAVLVALILTCTLAGRIIGVVGSSMEPTLYNGNLLLLQSLGYTPQQGDVVVLRKPGFPAPGFPEEEAVWHKVIVNFYFFSVSPSELFTQEPDEFTPDGSVR